MDKSQPRISANELGKYVFSNSTEKRRILKGQKVQVPMIVNRYQSAQSGILRSFKDGQFDDIVLSKELKILQEKPANSKYEISLNRANITAVRRFRTIREKATPPTGDHVVIRQNALFDCDGVIVSVRPDIITQNKAGNFFAYSKLRFSNHKYSPDASDIVLLVLEMFAEQQKENGLNFDMEKTKLIDCFSMQVFYGHKVSAFKRKKLIKSLAQIRGEWPTIPGPDSQKS